MQMALIISEYSSNNICKPEYMISELNLDTISIKSDPCAGEHNTWWNVHLMNKIDIFIVSVYNYYSRKVADNYLSINVLMYVQYCPLDVLTVCNVRF